MPSAAAGPLAPSPMPFRSVRQLSGTHLRQIRGATRQFPADRQPLVTRATSSTDSRQAELQHHLIAFPVGRSGQEIAMRLLV